MWIVIDLVFHWIAYESMVNWKMLLILIPLFYVISIYSSPCLRRNFIRRNVFFVLQFVFRLFGFQWQCSFKCPGLWQKPYIFSIRVLFSAFYKIFNVFNKFWYSSTSIIVSSQVIANSLWSNKVSHFILILTIPKERTNLT
jgi:hypothetical protein